MSANKYRGEMVLDLPGGAMTALVNSNALRMMMEDLQIEDVHVAMERINRNPVDMMPRLCYWGVHNWNLLTDGTAKVPDWPKFAAKVGTLDLNSLFEEISMALTLDDKKKGKGETIVSP